MKLQQTFAIIMPMDRKNKNARFQAKLRASELRRVSGTQDLHFSWNNSQPACDEQGFLNRPALRGKEARHTLRNSMPDNSSENSPMSAAPDSRLVDRSASNAMLVTACIVLGIVPGVLYLVVAFFSPLFGELALPSMLAFVEAFAKGCLFLLLGFAGVQTARGRKNGMQLVRFAASAGFLAFAGFALLTLLLSGIFDSWTLSYISRQGSLVIAILLLLFGALVYLLRRPDLTHAHN
jgi:hypothetical protein